MEEEEVFLGHVQGEGEELHGGSGVVDLDEKLDAAFVLAAFGVTVLSVLAHVEPE